MRRADDCSRRSCRSRCSLLLVLAPAAYASNDGRGFYGATNDKVVTNAGFILIVLLPAVRAR